MKKTTAWMLVEDGCGACRALAGTDGSRIEDRVAFIEKTPRVRIRDYHESEDWKGWAARPWKGDDPLDQESRDWCDKMLVLLGYELG